MAENEKETSSKKVSAFLEKNKKVFLIVLVVVIVAIIGFICGSLVGSSSKKKDLAKVDAISYALTNRSSELTDEDLASKIDETLNALASFNKKGGVVGVRSNLLSAELAYQKEDFSAAVDFYKAAASKGKKSYTTPIANYNLGACYEKLNNLDAAAESYKKAADAADFVLNTHAKFSYGRVLETQGKYKDAVDVYTDLNAKAPEDNWAKLAKTRIISLKAEGKVE